MLDQLTLSQLRVQGTLTASPTHRTAHQRVDLPASVPLDIDLELHLDLEEAGRSDDLTQSLDLSLVVDLLEMIATHGHWGTLESLGLALVRTLLLVPAPGEPRARLDAVTLRVRRPSGLGSNATPGIVLHRTRSWCATERRVLGPGVAADVIAETRTALVLRVRLTAGASWSLPEDAYALVLAGAVIDGTQVSTGDLPGALLLVQRR